jgi:hypothetical protein
VLDATTFCVLPSVLQVPVTIPLKTSEVKLPEKVPDVAPFDWSVTPQTEDVILHAPKGDIWREVRLPLKDKEQAATREEDAADIG